MKIPFSDCLQHFISNSQFNVFFLAEGSKANIETGPKFNPTFQLHKYFCKSGLHLVINAEGCKTRICQLEPLTRLPLPNKDVMSWTKPCLKWMAFILWKSNHLRMRDPKKNLQTSSIIFNLERMVEDGFIYAASQNFSDFNQRLPISRCMRRSQ